MAENRLKKSLFSIFFFGMKLAKEHCKKKVKDGNCLPSP